MTRLTASLLTTLSFALLAPAAAGADGDAARGKSVFNRCAACHTATDQNKIGPGLAGVLGRAAGTVPGARYSKTLPASGIVWDETKLDEFLAAPTKAVPGTSMPLGVPNAQDRADVIAYLKTLAKP